ncbi:MAG: AAA family ATPase [Pseudomonadota bacterium]|nr:AAA family ATPase [Pseudomonadota bacterium]
MTENLAQFQNLEAEQALLGSVLSNNSVLALFQLAPDDFSEPIHARIFDVAARTIADGRMASAVTLKNYFENDQTLAEIGGTKYLARLAASATTLLNVSEYAKLIKDAAICRRVNDLLEESKQAVQSLDVGTTGATFAADISMQFASIANEADTAQTRFSLKAALLGAIEQTSLAYQNHGKRPDAVATGIKALDNIIGGLIAESLVVLAGRPAMGKTSLGSVIAYNAAKAGVRTDFYSLDMTVSNLAQRIASIETKVPYERMQWGRISEREFTALSDAAIEIQNLPLTIVSHAGMTLASVGAEIAKSKMRNPDLFLVMIDQLSQIGLGGKFMPRLAEVTAITAGLKALAVRYKVCIVLLHQLSRAADAREGNRPQLSDLRDSGSLEQDANVVIFPFREEYYLTRDPPKENTPEYAGWLEDMGNATNKMEIIVAKNSMGRTGSARVKCELAINSITDVEDPNLEMF